VLVTVISFSNGHAVAGPKPAYQVAKGGICTLAKPLSGSVKKGKKPKPISIPTGSSVTVGGAPKKGATTVTWKGDIVTVMVKDLETFCEVAAPAPEKIAAAPVVTAPVKASEHVALIAKPTEAAKPVDTQKPVEAPVVERKAGGKPVIAIGVLAVPPGTKPNIAESVRELIADVIRDSSSLEYAKVEPEKNANQCVKDDACVRGAGQRVGADFAIGAWLKAEQGRGILAFRLIDTHTGLVVKTADRTITNTGDLPDEVVTATKKLLRDMTPEEAGMLVLKVNEPGTQVTLDGEKIGLTPINPKKLTGGEHTVLLEKDRFQTKTETFNIEPMRPNTVDIFFEPNPDFKNEYVSRNKTLRALAWTGVGLGIAGAAGIFAFRVAGNAVYDDLQRNDALLKAQGVPTSDPQYDALRSKSQWLPRLDGLTWGAGIVAGVGIATAITCFILGDDPKRYDKPKRHREKDDDKIGDLELQVSPTSLGLSGTF